MERTEIIERLKEIKDELLGLLDEAEELIEETGNSMAYNRSKAYWLAHAKTALTNDHGYMGGSMVTMENTIEEIAEYEEVYDEEECE